jgi:hypothetical protein
MKSAMSSIGSPKKRSPPCSLDLQQPALDGADAGRADVAVLGGELLGVVAHVLQHRAQVLQVQQQQAVVVGDLEHHVQHAGLRLVQRQHARQQQRSHVRDGGAHRVALRPCRRTRPTGGARAGHGFGRVDAALLQHRRHLGRHAAGLADAGEVALDVGHEHRHAEFAEVLGQRLQRDRLAGASGAGDQPVAVGQGGQQVAFDIAVAGDEDRVGHERAFQWGG